MNKEFISKESAFAFKEGYYAFSRGWIVSKYNPERNKVNNDDVTGTIVISATADSLDLKVSSGLTKEQTMQLLIETLHAVDDLDIDDDEEIPNGEFSAGLLQ